jgi:hypothetical protein
MQRVKIGSGDRSFIPRAGMLAGAVILSTRANEPRRDDRVGSFSATGGGEQTNISNAGAIANAIGDKRRLTAIANHAPSCQRRA